MPIRYLTTLFHTHTHFESSLASILYCNKITTAEEFLRRKLLSSTTITGEQNPSDDDEDDDDSDSTAPGGGGERGGSFHIRRRGIPRRQDRLHHQSQPKVDIAMVINLDLSNIDARHYTARLNYTKKLVISLFNPSAGLLNNINNDTTTTITTPPPLSAKDLVDILRTYRQKIPGELLTLSPPPPLMSPNRRLRVRRRHRVVGDALDVMGGGGGGGDVEGVRGNSEHENEEGKDDADDDGDFEDGGRMRSMVRRQQYLHVRNTMVRSHSSSASGDDDDDNGNLNMSETLSMLQSSSSTSSRVPLSSRPHFPSSSQYVRPNPVRRLRHAEVVLVDQCLSAYGRTWLRLRWPGELGGFAGFVAIGGGRAGTDVSDSRSTIISSPLSPGKEDKKKDAVLCNEMIGLVSQAPTTLTTESSMTASATVKPNPSQTSLLCQETNVCYPTSSAMKLLPLYDDGLSSNQMGEDETALLGTLVMDNGEVRFDWRFYLQLRRRYFY